MELKLTLLEVEQLIRQKLGLDPEIKISVDMPGPPEDPQVVKIINTVNTIEGMAIGSFEKIPAIKLFRQCFPGTSLGQAKWSIENWFSMRNFLRNFKRAPVFTENGNYNYIVT